jgi:hypothetical protein
MPAEDESMIPENAGTSPEQAAMGCRILQSITPGLLIVFDADVVRLFGVLTERRNEQVSRNAARFRRRQA